MPFTVLGAATLMSFMLAWVPGADWAYTISAALKYRSPVPAVLGLGLGYVFLAVMAAVGASALIAGIPGALATLTIIGATYLLWLGITTFLNPPTVQGVVPAGVKVQGTAGSASSVAVTSSARQFFYRNRYQCFEPQGFVDLRGALSAIHLDG